MVSLMKQHSPEHIAVKQLIQQELVRLGWEPVDEVSLYSTSTVAKLSVNTAAGGRTALAYCIQGNEDGRFHLVGDYVSEGTNVLASAFRFFPTSPTSSDVTDVVSAWVAEANAVIAKTYAVRLYASHDEPSNDGMLPG